MRGRGTCSVSPPLQRVGGLSGRPDMPFLGTGGGQYGSVSSPVHLGRHLARWGSSLRSSIPRQRASGISTGCEIRRHGRYASPSLRIVASVAPCEFLQAPGAVNAAPQVPMLMGTLPPEREDKALGHQGVSLLPSRSAVGHEAVACLLPGFRPTFPVFVVSGAYTSCGVSLLCPLKSSLGCSCPACSLTWP
jgi:hypothetical protein